MALSMGSGCPAVALPMRLANAILTWYILVLTLGTAYTIWFSTFVPSRSTLLFSYRSAVVTGLIYGVFALGVRGFGYNPQSAQAAAVLRARPFIGKAYVRVPLLSLTFFFFALTTFSGCIPGILNALVGSQGTVTLTVTGWEEATHSVYASRCARPSVSEIPDFLIPGRAMCPAAKRLAFPVGAHVVLHGKASAFGICPTRFTVMRH